MANESHVEERARIHVGREELRAPRVGFPDIKACSQGNKPAAVRQHYSLHKRVMTQSWQNFLGDCKYSIASQIHYAEDQASRT